MHVCTHCIGDARKAVAFEAVCQFVEQPPDKAGTLIGKRGIELNEARTGTDLGISVGARCDTTHSNQRELRADTRTQAFENLSRRRQERRTGESNALLRARR